MLLTISKQPAYGPKGEVVIGQCEPYTSGWRLRLLNKGEEDVLLEGNYYDLRQVQMRCQGKKDGEVRPRRPPFIQRDEDRYIVHMEKQSHPRYFPLKRNRTLLSEISDMVNHPHLVAARNEIASWRTYQVDPSRIRRETGLLGAPNPLVSGADDEGAYRILSQLLLKLDEAVGREDDGG